MIAWKKLKTEDEVRAAIVEHVGPGSSHHDVAMFAWEQGFDLGDAYEGVCRATIRGNRRGIFVTTLWMVGFVFGDDNRCVDVTVEEAATGP